MSGALKTADARAIARILGGQLDKASQEVELLTMKTHTSEQRNLLTDANIHLKAAGDILERLGKKEAAS